MYKEVNACWVVSVLGVIENSVQGFELLRKGRKAKTLLLVISWVILMELDRTNFEVF